MNVKRVREAIGTALDVIPDVQVNRYALSEPTPPGLQILPPGNTYDTAMHRGVDEWTFIIQGFVALTSDIGTQVVMDVMCGSSGAGSVKAALEADKTLGGLVESIHVIEQLPGRVANLGTGSPMLLVEWRAQVYARGTS